MLNQVAVEALYSATYVENYLDSVENLPDDAQRLLSRIRDIDVQCKSHLRDVDYYNDRWNSPDTTPPKKLRAMARMQQSLISAQELLDEQLQIVNQLHELIDHNTRQLDLDFKNLDYGKEEQNSDIVVKQPRPASPLPCVVPIKVKAEDVQVVPIIQPSTQNPIVSTHQQSERISNNSNSGNERSNKRSRRPRHDTNNTMETCNNDINATTDNTTQKTTTNQSVAGTTQKKATNASGGKKKKRKARGQTTASPLPEETIDPDEPTYCLCDQVSFGEMILCDNDLCPIEWFHFSCVSLITKPKGKWFCPKCRGDRPNVMKNKAQFLKELERYNKEKEEKT